MAEAPVAEPPRKLVDAAPSWRCSEIKAPKRQQGSLDRAARGFSITVLGLLTTIRLSTDWSTRCQKASVTSSEPELSEVRACSQLRS